ncbi:MAG: hypothetical protein IRY95_09220, partial [Clostridia bacterium]|nr:hypothetical protein [Clostridia bacterium]
SYCPRYAILDGGYAELACVPAVNCHPLPTGLSWAEAAAIPLVFITAWHMLVDRAAIRPGETVLVWGAGSGVGSAAVQIARHFGCQVVAVVGADWKVARARELGLRALRAGGGTSTAA